MASDSTTNQPLSNWQRLNYISLHIEYFKDNRIITILIWASHITIMKLVKNNYTSEQLFSLPQTFLIKS